LADSRLKSEGQVGLKEIARACNVSLMTVSRAFRENAVIKPATREMILKKAGELGYLPAIHKGRPTAPAENPSDQIQLIFGNFSGNMYYFHMRLLTALEQQFAENGYECIIRTCNGIYDIFVRLLERVRNDHSMHTVILGSFQVEQLEQLLLAAPGALLLDNHVRPAFQGKYTKLAFDNRRAAYLAVTHLVQCSRRRILLLTGPENHFFSREILMGYTDALADCQLEFDPRLVLNADFSASSAADVMRYVFSENIQFDAVFTNDEMATGVYRILHERNLSIPEMVSVCGCDDLPVGEQLYPELTTIALDYNELAACAVNHILSGKSSTVFPEIKLPPYLRIKKSTVF